MQKRVDNVLIMLSPVARIIDQRSQWILQRSGYDSDGKVTGKWRDWKYCATLKGLKLAVSWLPVNIDPVRLAELDKFPKYHPTPKKR